MAMRRRIKVAANLTPAKRKPKTEPNETSQPAEKTKAPEQQTNSTVKHADISVTPNVEKKPIINNDDTAFKYPPKVEFTRSNSHHTPSEEFPQTDIDDGAQVMQMDLQRTANGFPMSPSKTQRQRIKATPIFGQRRNSFVGPPPSPSANEEITEHTTLPPRRERHYSGSYNSIATTPTSVSQSPMKPPNFGAGRERVRTESTCSVFSDSHMSTTSKSRKADDHSTHRNQTRRDFEARFSNGVPEKSTLKMFDLIYYNPATNPMEQKPKVDEIKTETIKQETETDPDDKNEDNSAVPVPQLKLNAKGELILDDKSLEIETTAEQEARKVLAKSSLIYLDENTGMNGFYKRHKRTKDWPPDETIRFYRCLQTIGTDFSLMCQLFPNRTRRDLKLKFKKEERCNGALINKALLHPNSFNIDELKDQFAYEDKQKEEEGNKTKKFLEYKKVNVNSSKSARALKNAEDIYNFEFNEGEKFRPMKRKRTPKAALNEDNAEIVKEKKKRQPRKMKSETPKIEPSASCIKVEESLVPAANQTECQSAMDTSTYALHINPSNENIKSIDRSLEDDYIELLSIATSEQNTECSQENCNNFQHDNKDDDATETRTLVNIDTGNLTLIEDNKETSCTNFYDNQTATFVENNKLLDTDGSFMTLPMLMLKDTNTTLVQPEETVLSHTNDNSQSSTIMPTETVFEPVPRHEPEHSPEADTMPTHGETDFNDEKAIQRILEDIANGCLVVVSSFNPNAPDDQVNEIYKVDTSTGELCDEPLDLPAELVQSILSVMS